MLIIHYEVITNHLKRSRSSYIKWRYPVGRGGLKTSDAKQIGKKQNEKNTRAKNVNKTLSNNVNQAMGSAGGETIKVEENEKSIAEKFNQSELSIWIRK